MAKTPKDYPVTSSTGPNPEDFLKALLEQAEEPCTRDLKINPWGSSLVEIRMSDGRELPMDDMSSGTDMDNIRRKGIVLRIHGKSIPPMLEEALKRLLGPTFGELAVGQLHDLAMAQALQQVVDINNK